MLNPQQAELYAKIRAFRFDPPQATYTFAQRLASENGWSDAFARRAIEEYRRFLLLAASSGHPVSPPDVVDQVWHLHLLYTRTYWDDLSRGIMPRPLHHEPSTGGDRAKFDEWYANTLDSYRRTFDEPPPADIWPAPGSGGDTRARHRWIDLERNWVLSKSRFAHCALAALLAILLIALASGCAAGNVSAASDQVIISPFDLRGPQFLMFFAIAFVVACMLAWAIRSSARGPDTGSTLRLDLDPYEIAHLAGGGAARALAVAVTSLASRRLMLIDPKTRRIQTIPTTSPGALHPLESAVLRSAKPAPGSRLSEVRAGAAHELDRIRHILTGRGLLVDADRARAARVVATLAVLSVPAVGAIKIAVGVTRGKPVGFLVAACFISTILAFVLFARPLRRTRRGDRALERLTGAYRNLRRLPSDLTGADVPMAVALFGMAALAHTPLAPLRRTLEPQHQHAATYGSSCGGGCGGGGGSCGSSCGGGGGCGGCGGGGCGGS